MNQKLILILGIILSLTAASNALAADYNIKEMTPQVQSALESRRDRYDQIAELKNQNVIGEDNRGYVKVLKAEGNAQSLADAENRDRKTIYLTIAEQNGLGKSIATIEKVFAQVQREKASSGHQIQDESGNWKSK